MSLPTSSGERKKHPIATGLLAYFPDACAAVANASWVATQQHHPNKPMHWDRPKSNDHEDCLIRHFMERGTVDADGVRHSAKVAWRALAILQLELEATAVQHPRYEDTPRQQLGEPGSFIAPPGHGPV